MNRDEFEELVPRFMQKNYGVVSDATGLPSDILAALDGTLTLALKACDPATPPYAAAERRLLAIFALARPEDINFVDLGPSGNDE